MAAIAALAGVVVIGGAVAWPTVISRPGGTPGLLTLDQVKALSAAGAGPAALSRPDAGQGNGHAAAGSGDRTPGPARKPSQSPQAFAASRVEHLYQRLAEPPLVYRNPLRSVSGLLPERVDMGADFGGSGPVYALGDAVITSATASNSGWPGGGWITYRLTDGPAAGLMVYVAEDVTPAVTAGQQVTSATVIATMFDGGDGIETGWAQASTLSSESELPEAGGIDGNGPFPTAVGLNFEKLLQALGVPAGNNGGQPANGSLPPAYPSTWAGIAAARA